MGTIYILCISLIYSIMLIFIYFSKKRLNTIENKLFIALMLTNFVGLILDLLSIFTVSNMNLIPLINTVVTKTYLVYLFTWATLFTGYVFAISRKEDKLTINFKNNYWLLGLFYLIVIIIIYVLPLQYQYDSKGMYSYGMGTNLLYIIISVYFVIWTIRMVKNYKSLKSKKYLPIFLFMIFGFVVMIIQKLNPYLLLMTSMETFVTFLMYHTIENPDLQLLREFHKAREYANNLNTEKSEFLFNMAGEIKTPISVINRISKEVLMQDDINVIKSKVNDIKYSSNNLLELVNKVLDINSLEKRKVSVRESKYNTANLFKGIESQTELKLNNNLVEFRTNYDKSIPNELYGDSVRIRQIVNTLLENAIKYTKEGFIELSVNSIVKHDICRLVITVEDSGVGMTQDVVEHLFDKKLEKIEEIDNPKMDLGLVKTLLDLIGGTIIVNSELNHGTKFTIVLDQKVVNHKKNKTIEAVEKYEEMYLNNKKVMCVINDDTLSKKINTLFKKYQLDIEVVKLGQSCLEKVRAGEKFDLIIMEEHLEKLSSENTLAKLKSIQGFKTPVILLTDIKDINEKEEYLKLGFTEIVTLPLKKEQVEEIVYNYKLINK